MFDLTVASASHFVVSPGIIAQNCFDQLEQFTRSMYLYIQGACRTPLEAPPVDAHGTAIQPKVRASANPGDVGHSWVKSDFVDQAPPGTPWAVTAHVTTPDGSVLTIERSRVFITASVFDSVKAGVVGPEYIATLEAMPEPYRSAYLYGTWDVFVGQAFVDFLPLRDGLPYHRIPTEPVPSHWRRFESHDWGFSAPAFSLWWAIDPEGGVVIYREMSGRGWSPQEIAQRHLLLRGADEVGVTWADPSIFSEDKSKLTVDQLQALRDRGLGQLSVAEQYRRAGLVSIQPANNDRLAGKMQLHEALKEQPGRDGIPYLRIMDCCPETVRCLEEIQLDPKRSEDVITDYASDAEVRDEPYDCVRYGLMSLASLAPVELGPLVRQGRWLGGR